MSARWTKLLSLCALVVPVALAGSHVNASPLTGYRADPEFQQLSVMLLDTDHDMADGLAVTYTLTHSQNGAPQDRAVQVQAATSLATYEDFAGDVWKDGAWDRNFHRTAGQTPAGVRYATLAPGTYKHQAAALARLGAANADFELTTDATSSWLSYLLPHPALPSLLSDVSPGQVLTSFLATAEEYSDTIGPDVTTHPYLFDPTVTVYSIPITPGPGSTLKSETLDVFVSANNRVTYISAYWVSKSDRATQFSYDYTSSGNGTVVPGQPAGAVNVDHAELLDMSRRISAEYKAKPTAEKVRAKAQSLISTKGYPVNAATIHKAATLVTVPAGIVWTDIPKGARFTAMYSGVAGSMCVVIKAGHPATTPCSV